MSGSGGAGSGPGGDGGTGPGRRTRRARRQHRTHLMHWMSVGTLAAALVLLAADAGVVQAMFGAGLLSVGAVLTP